MKHKIILGFIIALSITSVMAQQPFEKYGYKVKIATLSHGKYNEFFDQDTLVQIGSVVLDRFTGKIVSFVTVDTVYSEATLQPELISRWLSPDPLSDKYFSYSPYNFVLNNPIRFIDPDGTTVKPTDDKALDLIKNTLSEKEAKYVKLDRNGNIKTRRLERGARKLDGGSENFKALTTLAKSDKTYNVSVSREYKAKDAEGNIKTGDLGEMTLNPENGQWQGTFGITLTPDNPKTEEDRSPDGNIWIIINPTAPERSEVETTAHEGYGHSYFYELARQGQNVNPYHAYETEGVIDATGAISITYIDTNVQLKEQIKTVQKLALNHYDQRQKKK